MSPESSQAGDPAAPENGWEKFAAGLLFRAGHCVHARSPIAACHACETACPRAAWRLGENGLNFDAAACDGCGLCMAVCPESAIRSIPAPLPLPQGKRVWFLACERSATDSHNLPCLHALADGELIAQWHRGCREIACAQADCAACTRAPPPERQLPARLDRLNRALRERDAEPLSLTNVEPATWQHAERQQRASTPDPARRGWLARIVAAAPEPAPEQRLPAAQDTQAPLSWPWLAIIDITRCTACDACVRLCPHQALRLEASAYISDPRNCTGCGLCADVCDAKAVRPQAWATAPAQQHYPLTRKTCAHCQAPFHAAPSGNHTHCRICRKTRHPRAALRIIES
ncbi:MAG: 4Fe-4S binding protein [Zoogloeaceae bacterium]|jgi:Pyruvate/2-oxoacid:ferredoxin oxidoreductase delta subunit|nr:4Fe-4S binding protein [Zoogloeaceae bacterium]